MSDLIKSIRSKLEALKGSNKKAMESRTEADPASPEARRQRSIDKIRSMGAVKKLPKKKDCHLARKARQQSFFVV